ncbi:hypothetical protein HDV00_006479 [Rhizophlyctis rosea]|nr:hypothetical protein HDV00_006479 [Rhizophlyctis rosea]
MLTVDDPYAPTARAYGLEEPSYDRRAGQMILPKRKWEEDMHHDKLEQLEATIREHLGTGKFFLVGELCLGDGSKPEFGVETKRLGMGDERLGGGFAAALREIEEDKLYAPEKSIYIYAKNKFSFSRRTTNTYLCSATVYESLVLDPTLPIPVNISHIRSLHKFKPEVRRRIWREVCRSGQTITEEHVVAMTVKYETGVAFSDLANELYTPPDIIAAARKVLTKPQFDLDPASTDFANSLHEPPLALTVYSETSDGLSKPWHGNVWLSPPVGHDANGPRQSKWFLAADQKFLAKEVTSVFVLLQVDLGSAWFTRVQRWPHCYFTNKLAFSTPTGREKVLHDQSHVLVYLGPQVDAFCAVFGRVGAIPGFNTWAFKSFITHPPPTIPTTLTETTSTTTSTTTKSPSPSPPRAKPPTSTPPTTTLLQPLTFASAPPKRKPKPTTTTKKHHHTTITLDTNGNRCMVVKPLMHADAAAAAAAGPYGTRVTTHTLPSHHGAGGMVTVAESPEPEEEGEGEVGDRMDVDGVVV